MPKLKAVIDRFEGDKAVLRAAGQDLIIPKKFLEGFEEGETVSIRLDPAVKDTNKSVKKAQDLVADIFKES